MKEIIVGLAITGLLILIGLLNILTLLSCADLFQAARVGAKEVGMVLFYIVGWFSAVTLAMKLL